MWFKLTRNAGQFKDQNHSYATNQKWDDLRKYAMQQVHKCYISQTLETQESKDTIAKGNNWEHHFLNGNCGGLALNPMMFGSAGAHKMLKWHCYLCSRRHFIGYRTVSAYALLATSTDFQTKHSLCDSHGVNSTCTGCLFTSNLCEWQFPQLCSVDSCRFFTSLFVLFTL